MGVDNPSRLIIPDHAEWPTAQLAVPPVPTAAEDTSTGIPNIAPPSALWLRGTGRLDQLTDRAVAIIGTRSATPYGMHVAADLAHGLAARGWTVLAGGSFGIESAAHRGALAAEGRTVAVLGSGLDRLYPSAHEALFRRIRAGGLLVTEQPPDAVMTRSRAIARDRLLAALATVVVVVEALPRGTCMRIAAHAEAYGRRLFAVPGPVTSLASAGCHQILRTGRAELVTNAADVLEQIER